MVFEQIPIIGAFVLAGLIWTGAGVFSSWRKGGASWTGFKKDELKNDVLLGLVLGVVAFFANAYQGNVVDVTNIKTFTEVVVGAFGVVALVDKYIVAGIFQK